MCVCIYVYIFIDGQCYHSLTMTLLFNQALLHSQGSLSLQGKGDAVGVEVGLGWGEAHRENWGALQFFSFAFSGRRQYPIPSSECCSELGRVRVTRWPPKPSGHGSQGPRQGMKKDGHCPGKVRLGDSLPVVLCLVGVLHRETK